MNMKRLSPRKLDDKGPRIESIILRVIFIIFGLFVGFIFGFAPELVFKEIYVSNSANKVEFLVLRYLAGMCIGILGYFLIWAVDLVFRKKKRR